MFCTEPPTHLHRTRDWRRWHWCAEVGPHLLSFPQSCALKLTRSRNIACSPHCTWRKLVRPKSAVHLWRLNSCLSSLVWCWVSGLGFGHGMVRFAFLAFYGFSCTSTARFIVLCTPSCYIPAPLHSFPSSSHTSVLLLVPYHSSPPSVPSASEPSY